MKKIICMGLALASILSMAEISNPKVKEDIGNAAKESVNAKIEKGVVTIGNASIQPEVGQKNVLPVGGISELHMRNTGCTVSSEGVASNFASDKYLETEEDINLGTDWEFVIGLHILFQSSHGGFAIKKGNTTVLSVVPEITYFGERILYKLADDYNSIITDISISNVDSLHNKNGIIKIKYENGVYTLSVDVGSGFSILNFTQSSKIISGGAVRIGRTYSSTNPYRSTFNLKNTYVKSNGVVVWSAVDAADITTAESGSIYKKSATGTTDTVIDLPALDSNKSISFTLDYDATLNTTNALLFKSNGTTVTPVSVGSYSIQNGVTNKISCVWRNDDGTKTLEVSTPSVGSSGGASVINRFDDTTNTNEAYAVDFVTKVIKLNDLEYPGKHAESPTNWFTYTLHTSPNKYAITGFSENYPGTPDIVFPNEFYGNPVTQIGHSNPTDSGFIGDTRIHSVTFQSNVLLIGTGCFKNCTNLKTVSFNDEIVTICGNAFYGTAVEDVTFPRSLTEICKNSGDSRHMPSFGQCIHLTNVVINCPNLSTWPAGDRYGNYSCFDGCQNIETVDLTGCTKLFTYQFNGDGIKKIILDPRITAVPNYAFAGNAFTKIGITDDCSINIKNITTINNNGFAWCGLVSNLECNATTIKQYAFRGLGADLPNRYPDITLHNTIIIENYAFQYSSAMIKSGTGKVVLPETISSIGDSFRCGVSTGANNRPPQWEFYFTGYGLSKPSVGTYSLSGMYQGGTDVRCTFYVDKNNTNFTEDEIFGGAIVKHYTTPPTELEQLLYRYITTGFMINGTNYTIQATATPENE